MQAEKIKTETVSDRVRGHGDGRLHDASGPFQVRGAGRDVRAVLVGFVGALRALQSKYL